MGFVHRPSHVVALAAALALASCSVEETLADRATPPPSSGPSVAPYVGLVAAGLAVVASSTAVVAGSVASAPPSGDTRKLRQEDIERRENYAVAANVALAAGGVFSAVAIVSFLWH